jgi:chromosome partitioning protein
LKGGSKMKIVALATQKGGCGKSSTAINLSCQAHAAGEFAALLDMDEGQHSSLNWAKRRTDEAPSVMAVKAFKLTSVLNELKTLGTNWVFIDLPGRDAPAANAGLAAAHFVLIPCRPLTLDFEASLATVQAAVRARKPYAYLLSIVPVQGDKARAKRFADELREASQPVCPVFIVQRAIVPDAIAEGRCACEAEPNGESAREFAELFQWLKGQVK